MRVCIALSSAGGGSIPMQHQVHLAQALGPNMQMRQHGRKASGSVLRRSG